MHAGEENTMSAEKTCERVTKDETRQDAEPGVCGRAPAHFWVHFGRVLCYACGTDMARVYESPPLARYGRLR
jgi:hypothetical protein